MISWFKKWVSSFPLVAYFVLVFGIEWLLVFGLVSFIPPMISLLIGSWLPNIVGLIVTGVASGRTGLRELFSKIVLWRISFKWYVFAVFIPTILALLAIGLDFLFSNAKPEFAPQNQLIPIILLSIFTGAMGEELGWRGTALPRLQARYNALSSGLLLGVFWGLYHLPSFLLSGLPLKNAPLIPFMFGAIGLTIFVSWTFNHTSGSLIPVFLYHFMFNFILNVTGIPNNPNLFWLLGSLCVIAAFLIVVFDRNRFTQSLTTSTENTWVVKEH